MDLPIIDPLTNDPFDKRYLFCSIIDNRAAALSIVIAGRGNSFSFQAT